MMSRTLERVLFVFFLVVLMDFGRFSLAEEKVAQGVIVRPAVEYKSGGLRDPFKEIEEIKVVQPQEKPDSLEVAGPDFDKLKVQGIIWGGRFPQAIINNKVFSVGDSIEGVEILSIDKNGINLSSAGKVASLSVTAKTPVLKKGK